MDWSVLDPLLQRITISSNPVGLITPDKPFRYVVWTLR